MTMLRSRGSGCSQPDLAAAPSADAFVALETPRATGKTDAPRLTLEWRQLNLTVAVQNPQTKTMEDKAILQNVSGVARPGELLVIMGPSGAGKSTLLDCISGRNAAVQGSVTVNGSPWTKRLKRFASYVMQDDVFHATLTVREHLTLQARLRMGGRFSKVQYTARVDTVIEELGLAKSKDTLIGGFMLRGISGGERKRLAFATEILTNPSVLFVDEPTSGLDSFMAKAVVLQLQALAARDGRTVVTTIHQPSSEVFALFDELYLISDGSTVYQGKASESLSYFASLGFQCPTFINPADFFMEQLVVVDKETDPVGVERVQSLKDHWSKSQEAVTVVVNPQDGVELENRALDGIDFQDSRLSMWGQIRVLTYRNALRLLRDKMAFRLEALQTLISTLLVGIIYFQLTLDQQGVKNFSGAFFYIVTDQVYAASMPAMISVPIELPIVYREYDVGLYHVTSWFLAKNLCELPSQVVLPIICLLPSYFLIGIGHDFAMYIQMQLLIIFVNSSSVAFGYAISCVCRRVDIAPIVGNIVLMPLLLLGGLFVDPSDVPGVFRWIQYITPFKYGYYGLMRVFFRGVPEISCEDVANGCMSNGQEVLANYKIGNQSALQDILLLVALSVGYRVIAMLALYTNVKRR